MEPISATMLLTLAVSKFTEAGVSKAAEKLVDQLWNKISDRLKNRKKSAEALAQIEASHGNAQEAQSNIARVLDGEMFEDDDFANQLQQLAQQIINIQNENQTQNQTSFQIDANDNATVNAIGNINAATVNFGNKS